jgi:hypothetical protein
MITLDAGADWTRMLKDYACRNTGRLVRLEIADPEVGAQWAGVDLPLRGIAYDPREDRVEIMLGEAGGLAPHLTHSIRYPTGVDVVDTGSGSSEVLRIAHCDGETLLHPE